MQILGGLTPMRACDAVRVPLERSAAAERLSDVTASCDDRDLQKALLSTVILQDLDAGQP